MKYIRTKDRIREIIEDFGSSCNVKSVFPKGRPSIDNFTVVTGVRFAPRADTIEELCDEFVVVYKDSEPYLTQHLSYAEMEEYNASLIGNGGIIYAAIWTDKGLIYVAKMNDKGELELL